MSFFVGALVGLILQGSFWQTWLAIVYFYVALPTFLVLVVWSVRVWAADSEWRGVGWVWMVLAGVTLAGVVSMATGVLLHHVKVNQTQETVAAWVVRLDEYHAEKGTFPNRLEQLGEDVVASPVFSFPLAYEGAGDRFRFEYWSNAGFLNGNAFSSDSRAWSRFD